MPEPNLPPLRLRAEQVEGERANLPELPQQTRLRIQVNQSSWSQTFLNVNGGFLRIIW